MAPHPWRQVAAIVGATCAVFAGTLSAGLVYDARLQILTDTFLFDPANWLPVLTYQTLAMDVLDFNRPVNLASLMLDAAVWGREPFGYHLTSVLEHVGNVLLVWAILGQLAPGLPPLGRLVAPLVFAVHPLVTEAVCEPSFREDLLVSSFTLLGLWLAIGKEPAATRHDVWRAIGFVACALLAIGSKESGVAAPAAIAVYWLAIRRGERGWFWPVVVGGATVAVVGFLMARFLLEPTPSKIFEQRPQYPGGSLAAAMLIEPRILALYAQLVFLPVNQCADYGLHSVSHLPLPLAVGVVAVVGAAYALAIRADRRIAVAATLIGAPLLAVANLFPIYRAAADRYLYLPLAGVGLTVGLLLDAPSLLGRERRRRQWIACFGVAVIMLGVACMERAKVWTDQLSLWTDTVRKNPVAFTGASGLAEALRDMGRLAEAEEAARRAIQLSEGRRGDPWATLALILDDQGRQAEAFAALEKAVSLDPKLGDPDGRVAVMAMERPFAEDLKRLQARRKALP